MELKTITKKVVSYCDIPEDIEKPDWLEEASCDSYVECHIEDEDPDELTEWLIATYPELKDLNESFFIHVDY